MPIKEIVKDSRKYAGQYVATKSFRSRTVVSHGKDPLAVWDDAEKKGVKDPVVFFIPRSDMKLH
ncbi:MAG: hypothetical protein HZA22_06720 [Nitrospirae bacterium]|nr:hypothetical protein [Nitrospirota bacterium]